MLEPGLSAEGLGDTIDPRLEEGAPPSESRHQADSGVQAMPPREAKNKTQRERDEERKSREAGLDHTLEESFPASDPPSSIPDPLDADAVPESGKPCEDEAQ